MTPMPPAEPPITPVTQECMVYVSQQLQLPLQVLYGVLYTERGAPGKVSKNTNGTVDIGPMQINEIHVPFFERNYGWRQVQLKNNGCLNVLAGGLLLRMQILKAGGDIWKGIGNYHSRTPVHHERYQLKVADFLKRWGAVNTQQVQAVQQQQYMVQAQESTQQREPERSAYRRY